MSLYQHSVHTISGEETTLETYRGQILLIVNVASKCGFTKQYTGLTTLYETYSARGFAVLGFPCNQFFGQEPEEETAIARFCDLNFGVTFPLFSKIEVNGPNTHPLYRELKSRAPGLLGSQRIKWNFTKFLVSRDGETITRFAPSTSPKALAPHIEALL